MVPSHQTCHDIGRLGDDGGADYQRRSVVYKCGTAWDGLPLVVASVAQGQALVARLLMVVGGLVKLAGPEFGVRGFVLLSSRTPPLIHDTTGRQRC